MLLTLNIYFNLTGQQCPILPPIPNGIITYAPDNTPDIDIGTTATYQCSPGFLLVGDMTRVCGQDGVFNGIAPACERKDPINVLHAFSQSIGIYRRVGFLCLLRQ